MLPQLQPRLIPLILLRTIPSQAFPLLPPSENSCLPLTTSLLCVSLPPQQVAAAQYEAQVLLHITAPLQLPPTALNILLEQTRSPTSSLLKRSPVPLPLPEKTSPLSPWRTRPSLSVRASTLWVSVPPPWLYLPSQRLDSSCLLPPPLHHPPRLHHPSSIHSPAPTTPQRLLLPCHTMLRTQTTLCPTSQPLHPESPIVCSHKGLTIPSLSSSRRNSNLCSYPSMLSKIA